MSRVVVTGLGAVTPLGLGALESFEAALLGRSGVAKVSLDLDDRYDVRIAGEVKALDATEALGPVEVRRHHRFTQMAAVAALEASRDAGFRDAGYAPERVAVVVGVGFGGLSVLEEGAEILRERGPQRVSPFAIPGMIPNMAAGMIASTLGAEGPCYATSSACASGAHALGDGLMLLRTGAVDAVICGGAEAVVTKMALAAFARMRALSTRNDEPTLASRPFDRDRGGFVLSEGAAILVLEREDRARRRGARIYAELAGFGASADASHPTNPAEDGRGAARAIRAALASAEISAGDVAYVNAHGTGTLRNDAAEATAIRTVFGHHADTVPVSSTKGATGHMMGAAGAFEALVCVLAVHHAKIPPTVNLENPDPDCPLGCLPTRAREVAVDVALSNSFGFAGQNGSILFRSLTGRRP